MFAGDSYTVGYGNTGGTTMCNMTVCSPVGICSPELDSQNSAIAWGPLTAANFSADYEVIAWSGAEVADYSVAEVFEASLNLPAWIGENLYPLDGDLFMRQVAADNSSMVSNFSSWVPQVRHVMLHTAASSMHFNAYLWGIISWTTFWGVAVEVLSYNFQVYLTSMISIPFSSACVWHAVQA